MLRGALAPVHMEGVHEFVDEEMLAVRERI
jgi:hypothetical protein